MLFINWKKHYDVPNIIYYDNTFKQSRKAKHFFLSDFVFKLIHKYCFRRILYYYIDHLFNKRVNNTFSFVTNVFYKKHSFFNNNIMNKFFIYYHQKKVVLYHHINHKIRYFWFRFFFFEQRTRIIKAILNDTTALTVLYYLFCRQYSFFLSKWLFVEISSKMLLMNNILSEQCYVIFNNKNILFLLYQVIDMRKKIKIKCNFLIIKHKFFYLLFYSIHKCNLFFKRKKQTDIDKEKKVKMIQLISVLLSRVTTLKRILKFYYFSEFDLEDINFVPITYVSFFSSIHNNVYDFLYNYKMNNLNNYNTIHYYNLMNLKFKKKMILKLKSNILLFQDSLESVLFKIRRWFYIFLNNTFGTKNQWLIGPKTKIRLFRYVTVLFYKIRSSFMSLQQLSSITDSSNNFKTKKLSFFYNTLKIRKELFIILGKKRYIDEFFLLNNKKWILNFYSKWYYNLNSRSLLYFYKLINKQYKVIILKDLFLFLEYKISVFLEKYLSYTYYDLNNIFLNGHKLNKKKNTFFFIGDVIKINVKSLCYYDKFFMFFNFFYCIDPIKLKNKYLFFNFIYNKVYNYFYTFFLDSFSNNSNNSNTFITNVNNMKLINLVNSLIIKNKTFNNNNVKLNDSLLIKSILFLCYKNNILFNNNILNMSVNNNLFNNLNVNYYFFIFSFGKFYKQVNLLEYKKSYLRTNKQLSYIHKKTSKRIRVHVPNNLYKLLFNNHKKNKYLLFNGTINSFFNNNYYHNYFKKKQMLFYSNKDLFNFIYKSNF